MLTRRTFPRLPRRLASIGVTLLVLCAVVGCGDATECLTDGQDVTVSCAEGDEGRIYEGILEYEEQTIQLDKLPEIPVKIMMNVGNPDRAFDFSGIPNRGVGLAGELSHNRWWTSLSIVDTLQQYGSRMGTGTMIIMDQLMVLQPIVMTPAAN